MQISADRIWKESLPGGWQRLRISKADTTVTHVKKDPALPRFIHKRYYLIGLQIYKVFPGAQLAKTMGENVAGPQVFHKQLFN